MLEIYKLTKNTLLKGNITIIPYMHILDIRL